MCDIENLKKTKQPTIDCFLKRFRSLRALQVVLMNLQGIVSLQLLQKNLLNIHSNSNVDESLDLNVPIDVTSFNSPKVNPPCKVVTCGYTWIP